MPDLLCQYDRNTWDQQEDHTLGNGRPHGYGGLFSLPPPLRPHTLERKGHNPRQDDAHDIDEEKETRPGRVCPQTGPGQDPGRRKGWEKRNGHRNPPSASAAPATTV